MTLTHSVIGITSVIDAIFDLVPDWFGLSFFAEEDPEEIEYDVYGDMDAEDEAAAPVADDDVEEEDEFADDELFEKLLSEDDDDDDYSDFDDTTF